MVRPGFDPRKRLASLEELLFAIIMMLLLPTLDHLIARNWCFYIFIIAPRSVLLPFYEQVYITQSAHITFIVIP